MFFILILITIILTLIGTSICFKKTENISLEKDKNTYKKGFYNTIYILLSVIVILITYTFLKFI